MIRKREYLVLIAIVSLLCCTATVAAAANDVNRNEPVVLSEAQQKLQTIVSVNFRNTPIEEAISFLAGAAGVDIIKSPQVTGTVTATITNATLGEVLENILALNDAGYVATDRVIRVVPRAEMELQKEQRVHKVYRISYADVRQVAEALKGFISEDADLGISPGTGNIIVTDTASKIRAIDEFLEEIDRPVPQILVEVRIYDITSKDALDLGVVWNAGTATTFDTGSDMPSVDSQTGPAADGHTNPFIRGVSNSAVNMATGTDNSFRFGFLTGDVDIDVLLRAQQQNTFATLLANPRILVLDQERASFKSVSQIPYQVLTETAAGGNIGTTAFREVGVMLDVIPHITRDSTIRLQIMPEFSIATGAVTVGGFEVTAPQPIVDSRRASTTLVIGDGKTVVLGGLRSREVQHQLNKVPVLGDIPVLGNLFRFSGDSTVNRELVVFITPRIVVEPMLTAPEQETLGQIDTDLSDRPSADSTRM
ncbi:MAG TPA: secretin N-terminal domain-containing protein [Sedimentisphaerales bacterium]|nr:secretin N-terminal domain-containing protein [Sedimentisphaerales bacterium]